VESAPRTRRAGFEEAIQECLKTLESADTDILFEIIPRIGVLRDARFVSPLLQMLRHKDVRRRQFAAYAIGAMRERQLLEPLKEAFTRARRLKGRESEELLVAVIESIGALGDDAAAEFFRPILLGKAESAPSRKLSRWIVESLGAIAQQGGNRALELLLSICEDGPSEIRAQAISEIAVAYWHRPNTIPEAVLETIFRLTRDRNSSVAQSALSALESLADVGCRKAENLFQSRDRC